MYALIFEAFMNLFDYIMLTILFKCFLGEIRIAPFLYNILLFVLAVITAAVNVFFENDALMNFIFSMSVILVISLLYKQGIKLKLLFSGLFAVFGVCSEMFGFLMIMLISSEYNLIENLYSDSYMMSIAVIKLVLALIILIVTRHTRNRHQLLPQFFNFVLFTIPIISTVVLLILADAVFLIQEKPLLIKMIAPVAILYINVIVFLIFNKSNEMASLIMEQRMMEQEIKYKDKYYGTLEKKQDELRELKHNLNNLVLGIKNILLNSHTEEARVFLKEISEFDSLKNTYTQNPIVNSILDDKIQLAEAKQIKSNIQVQIPQQLNVNPGDMGIIIGNLLDNAIEANERLTAEQQRFITIDISYERKCLLIDINNPIPDSHKKAFNYKVSSKESKEEHGIGLKSVEKIISKYDGNLKIEHADHFRVSVMLTKV